MRRKGIAMLMVMAALMVIGMMSAAAAILIVYNTGNVMENEYRGRAGYAAQAGIQRVLLDVHLNTNRYVRTSPPYTVTAYSKTPIPGQPDVTYTVKVVNNLVPPFPPGGEKQADDGNWVAEAKIYISAVGAVKDRATVHTASLTGLGTNEPPEWDTALRANFGVVMEGDASVEVHGGGGPLPTPFPGLPPLPTGKASVAVPEREKQALVMRGTSRIEGDVYLIKGADPAQAVEKYDSATVTGNTRNDSVLKNVPQFVVPAAFEDIPVQPAPAAPAPGNAYAGLTQTGGQLTLAPGDYYFLGDVDLDGVEVIATGPVRIFLGADVTMKNNCQVNMGTDRPQDVKLYFAAKRQSEQKLEITNSQASMLSAGRFLSVEMTDCELYGAILGRRAHLRNGARLRYDPSLDSENIERSLIGFSNFVFAERKAAGGGGYGGGGCFIATAAYGSPMAAEVQRLRDFRDAYLVTNPPGRAFVRAYYRCSPPVADWIAPRPWARATVRAGLTPLVHPLPTLACTLLALLGLVRYRRSMMRTMGSTEASTIQPTMMPINSMTSGSSSPAIVVNDASTS